MEQNSGLEDRFYCGSAAEESDESLTACVDCGALVISQHDAVRKPLCNNCYMARVLALHSASQRGFRLGL
jgi:hypothetical protein